MKDSAFYSDYSFFGHSDMVCVSVRKPISAISRFLSIKSIMDSSGLFSVLDMEGPPDGMAKCTWDVIFALKVGQIGPKWDKSGTFSHQF